MGVGTMDDNIVFTSEPMRIGKTDWRFLIEKSGPWHGGNYVSPKFEWFDGKSWRIQEGWPRFNNDLALCGLPKTIMKLWIREEHARKLYGVTFKYFTLQSSCRINGEMS